MDEPDEEVIVNCKLSSIMGARRLKIADVARRTGVHRNVITRYYRDDLRSYDREILAKICSALKVSPGELLEIAPRPGKN